MSKSVAKKLCLLVLAVAVGYLVRPALEAQSEPGPGKRYSVAIVNELRKLEETANAKATEGWILFSSHSYSFPDGQSIVILWFERKVAPLDR